MNILIKNADIITCNDKNEVIRGGCIGIKNGYIEFVHSNKDCPKDFKADKIIDGKDKIIIPGMVNAHTHSAMTILRNYANDLSLEDWLFKNILPSEAKLTSDDIYWGTLLGIGEMIKSGTTAFADMYYHMDSVVNAVIEAGIRANLCRSPLKYSTSENHQTSERAPEFFEFYKTWNGWGNDRIKVYVEVHSVYLFDEDHLKVSAQIAKELGTGIHIHLSETLHETSESIKKYGMSPIQICNKTGIFDNPVIAAHCVHLSEEDIVILKDKRVNAVHNPTSNLKLGSGIAKVPELLEKGINVSIGTDGAASNNNLNMLEEIHLTALLHKGVHMNPTLLNAYDVLKMATARGAKTLGFGADVGTIEKGMKADIVIIDADKVHMCPVNDPVSAAVYCAQGSDVDTVIIDGNIVMDKGELKTIDEEKVKHKVREIAKRVL